MIAKEIIKKEIRKASKVLDLGCGEGAWGDLVDGREFHGIDVNDQFKPRGYLMRYGDLDDAYLPYEEGYFDLIIAKDILEHLHTPMTVLDQVNYILRRGGTLIVKVPDYRSVNAWEDYTHVRPYTKGAVKQMLTDAGFEVLKVIKLGGYFFPSIFPQACSWLVVARK